MNASSSLRRSRPGPTPSSTGMRDRRQRDPRARRLDGVLGRGDADLRHHRYRRGIARRRYALHARGASAALTGRFEALEQRVMGQFAAEGAPPPRGLARAHDRHPLPPAGPGRSRSRSTPAASTRAAGERDPRALHRAATAWSTARIACLLSGGNEAELHRVVGHARRSSRSRFPEHPQVEGPSRDRGARAASARPLRARRDSSRRGLRRPRAAGRQRSRRPGRSSTGWAKLASSCRRAFARGRPADDHHPAGPPRRGRRARPPPRRHS